MCALFSARFTLNFSWQTPYFFVANATVFAILRYFIHERDIHQS
jgi:hypothetical protein